MFYFAMNLMSFQSKVFSGIEIAEVYCELQGIVLWNTKEMGINCRLCGGVCSTLGISAGFAEYD